MSTPMITSISPSAGPSGGGTQVSIAGSGLSTVTDPGDVLFGEVPAAVIVSVTDTLLTVTSPPAAALGTVAVSVVTPNGAVIWENAFDYEVSVVGISPASGPVTGGTSVTITGSGMLSVFGVQFGTTAASTMVVANDTQLTVTTPAAAAPGSVDVILTGLTGNTVYIELGGFSYVAAPATTPAPAPTGTTPTPAPGGTTPAPTPAPTGTTPTPTPGGTTPTPAPTGTTPTPTGTTPTPTPTPTGTTPTPAPTGATPTPGGATPTPAGGTTTASTTPPPGNYIPGGAMIVPGGQTGLGGSAGTGAGFGVGTLMAGGGGSAPPSNLPYYVDPGLTAQLVQSLISIVQTATSPDAMEAQNMILRRMALEGDVVGSRIPPPRNVSEIGGYFNLLSSLNETTMREQALAGILGVAGPAQPLGWISNDQPLSMVAVTNDRPTVAAQPSFPLSVLVRSDFVAGVQNALKLLHSYGGTLPLTSPSVILLPPGGTGATIANPILFYIGRMLTIAPSAALTNPVTDPVALLAPTGPGGDYWLASQVLNPAQYTVEPADLLALQCTPTTCSVIQLSQVSYVPIGPIFAAAGFYSPSPLPVPANSTQNGWIVLANTTGLVTGVTMLGDELSLLYRQDQIAASAFAAMLEWTWDGSTFAPLWSNPSWRGFRPGRTARGRTAPRNPSTRPASRTRPPRVRPAPPRGGTWRTPRCASPRLPRNSR